MGSPRLALVGAFVVGGLLLFAVGLFMIGDRRQLFTEHFEVVADFGNVTGLQVGTDVRLSGLPAGEVTDIVIPPAPGGRFEVRMRVREDLHSLVRTDSVAAVLTDGLLGSAFLQIRSGTESAPEVADGGRLSGADAVQIADLIEEGRETFRLVSGEFVALREQMTETFAGLGETVETTTLLISDVGNDVRAVSATSALFIDAARGVMEDTRGLLQGVSAGEGTAGKLLTDDALYTHMTGLVGEVEATMRSVRVSAEQFEQIVGGLQGPESAAQRLLVDAGDVVTSARDAMADLAENTEAMKRNWLLRGFFSDRGFYNLDEMTVDEYRALLRDERYAPLRIWLGADVLFETDGGRQSDVGRRGRRAHRGGDGRAAAIPAQQPAGRRGLRHGRRPRPAVHHGGRALGGRPGPPGPYLPPHGPADRHDADRPGGGRQPVRRRPLGRRGADAVRRPRPDRPRPGRRGCTLTRISHQRSSRGRRGAGVDRTTAAQGAARPARRGATGSPLAQAGGLGRSPMLAMPLQA